MSLIAISGKIGSGKDTIAKIIQYLVSDKKWIGVAPFEAFEALSPHNREDVSKWEIRRFAGKLKQIVSLLTGIPVQDLEKQEVKDSRLGEEWYIPHPSVPYYSQKPNSYTVRELLQKVGTDALRNVIHPNVHVNALFADYKLSHGFHYSEGVTAQEYPNWIIPDMRFPNEFDAVKKRNGITIRVNRFNQKAHNLYNITGHLPVEHLSETALDSHTNNFDYYIRNDGTIEGLVEIVKAILLNEKII